MKIILTQNVNKLGKAGEIKEVSDGYARNMLLPKGAAIIATPEAIRALEFQKELQVKKSEKELEQVEKAAENLDGTELVFTAKTQEDGKLFGSITENHIADKIKELGFSISKKQVKLDNHIKNTGEHEATVNFDHGLEAQIKIIVEPEISEQRNKDIEI